MEEVTLIPQTLTETRVENASPHNRTSVHRKNHTVIALMGSCGVVVWIMFFSLGMLIDSSQYRTPLLTRFNWYQFFMAVLTYTPTNIAILCLVSAFTGGCASLLVISKAEKALGLDKQSTHKTSSHVYMSESPFSSLLRGIVVFFAFLGGVVVTSSTALSAPSFEAYIQAAGVVSMLSFVVGYDPTMFRALISIGEKMNGKSHD